MKWVKLVPLVRDLLIHIPNEGKRSPRYGNKLVKMGLKRGVSDFFLPLPKKNYHGLWIELKRKKKYSISQDQKDWIEKMQHLGFKAEFAYGFEEAKRIVEAYLLV